MRSAVKCFALAMAILASCWVAKPVRADGWSDLIDVDPQIEVLFDAVKGELEALVTDGKMTRGASGSIASLLFSADTLICAAWQISARQLEQEIVLGSPMDDPPYQLIRDITELKERIVAACDLILQQGLMSGGAGVPVPEQDIGVPDLRVPESSSRYLESWGYVDDTAYQRCFGDWLEWRAATAAVERSFRGRRFAELRGASLRTIVLPGVETDISDLEVELELARRGLPGQERDVRVARLELRIDQLQADLDGYRRRLEQLIEQIPRLEQELIQARQALPAATEAIHECMSIFDLGSGSPIVSLFETNAGNWTVEGDAGPSPAFAPGEISATDRRQGSVWYWVAPAPYHGDHSLLYGARLVYRLRVTEISKSFEAIDVVIEGGGLALHLAVGDEPGIGWTEYRLALDVTEGWTLASEGRLADADEIQQVLGDITALKIRGEFNDGPDTGWLSHVVLGERG